MPDLPSGTVTFVFTDVEGSTRLWERHPEQMRAALAEHDALIEFLAERHGGRVVRPRGEGDSRFCVFARATDAVAAAAAIQRALHEAPWPEEAPLRVRMAVHTGEADLRDGDYYGPDVNRAARLRGAGHGGQTLVSETTVRLLGGALPSGAGLRDLGERRLKDLVRPERVYQLVLPGLPAAFPPLATLDARPHNLPVQPTPLVGRVREVARVREHLLDRSTRLLTLTGPGGTGKTRLALQAAAEVIDEFDHGVWFVALAPIGSPTLVLPATAHVLGVKEAAGRALADTLKDYLREKALLLVFDSFEHVADGAPLLVDLLAACPRLRALVTSRSVLRVHGEREFPVPALGLPAPQAAHSPGSIAASEAGALFHQRAAAARPDFQLTAENAAAVAQICARLDGLPLAIELAAARVKVLSPHALLARLERRLAVLTGGPRDMPARQQTLRAAIDWSYALLEPEERVLFARLAVFAGGCTPHTAAAVCGERHGVGALDGLTSLADKSLLRLDAPGVDGAQPRFWMLRTIREYAIEKLEASGDAGAIRRRHAEHFLALAEAAEPHLRGAQQVVWLDRLEREHDNLRAALAWSQSPAGVVSASDAAEAGLRLAGALYWFWFLRGYWSEGRGWLAGALAAGGPEAGEVGAAAGRTRVRAKALRGAGILVHHQGDLRAAGAYLEQSLAISRELGDTRGVASSLIHLGLEALLQRGASASRPLLEEGAGLFERTGDTWGQALALYALARATLQLGEAGSSLRLAEKSVVLFRETGDRWGTALSLMALGNVAFQRGDHDAAQAWYGQALALRREMGDKGLVAHSLSSLADVARCRGEFGHAAELLRESLALFRELGSKRNLVVCLSDLAGLTAEEGQLIRAARLFGAVEALLEAIASDLDPLDRSSYERNVAAVRAGLDEGTFTAAWAQGRALSLEQAIACALESGPTPG